MAFGEVTCGDNGYGRKRSILLSEQNLLRAA
jgi:hypothetical protein